MISSSPRTIIPFIILIVIFDQATKFLALRYLHTVCNRGIAFGLLPDFANVVISVAVVLIVGSLLTRSLLVKRGGSSFGSVGLSLILAGGVSNLIDRLVRGCVVDFVNLRIWPAFNLADSLICIGVGLLVIVLVLKGENK
ncbi:MAG TPA: signal peptidase II [Candidatus Saccharimonadales bacterium]|nr:signal peptidase II [Candidatus Saccharimonadales bacterium]